MPELPEVETVMRGLSPFMEGAKIVAVTQNRPDLRFPFPENFIQRLTGCTVVSLSRRAKFVLVDLSSEEVLVMHLGMSGSFRIVSENTSAKRPDKHPGAFHHERSKDEKHDHVVLSLEVAGRQLSHVIYNDPRRFGYMDLVPRSEFASHRHFTHLGIEPLGNAFDAHYLSDRFKGRRTPLKSALLDQRIIAGLGNIYVCEALWRARLSPFLPAGALVRKNDKPKHSAERLVGEIQSVLADAIKAGGSSLRDHVQTDGSMGYFQHSFSVYDREGQPCPRSGCPGIIEREIQSGRSTFFCNRCQKR